MRIAIILSLAVFINSVIYPQINPRSDFNTEAAKIAASLSDHDLAAQVLLTGIDGKVDLVPAMKSLLQRIPAGGILLFKYNLDSSKDEVKKLLSSTADIISANTGIPPFMAVDHEGGMVHRFGAGVQRLPSPYSFWELAQTDSRAAAVSRAEILYRLSAKEIHELGISMVLGPVAEVLTAENSAFLETRSYGPDSDFVQKACSAFVNAMDSAGIACVLKHFPGNNSVDPHFGSSSIAYSRSSLDRMAGTFADLIKIIHIPSIMVSHNIFPARDALNNASLSDEIISVWLKKELGFSGIVLADDFSMKAITDRGIGAEDAVILALNAGTDMVMCWPSGLSRVHSAVMTALKNGRLPRSRLEDAASRILAEKLRYGLIPAGSTAAAGMR